ncbi:YegP family protein [Humisphaera borealis]|uniref:YegP family protein n=1 Tax=Humisphaera borealis TaxID=2807512 RepID=A0A7M2X0X5_9BACT|nr:YegP family protein [Humisphaera borealis]QOV91082.1 YegP family protein [Humisphaera borealis]
MAGKFELKKSPSGKFMFNLKAGNGQVILTSELYNEKASAENGIASVKKNSADDARFERKKSKNDEPYFVLTATNGQTIGKSEMYTTTAAMENGIASVKTNGPTAAIDDTTAA